MREIRILILSSGYTNYVIQLYHYIKKYYTNVKYSIFTKEKPAKQYLQELELEDGEEIYYFGNHEYLVGLEAAKLPKFDIIHSLWFEHFWGEFAMIFKSKSDFWFGSVGGSDLYRESFHPVFKMLQKRIIKRCSLLSSENTNTKEIFEQTYGSRFNKIEHRIISFGVDIIDFLNPENVKKDEKNILKQKYGVPIGKIVVVCGTCARVEHQHTQIIEEVDKLPSDVKKRICLLFPMTYSGEEPYITSIEKSAKSVIDDVVVLREYMSAEEMAEVVSISDVLIHVQTTDQLNSTMVAHMYNGNVVIAGSWLPYGQLKDKGIKFWETEELSELHESLCDAICNLDNYKLECKENKNIIYDMSSWEKSAKRWYEAYTDIMKGE